MLSFVMEVFGDSATLFSPDCLELIIFLPLPPQVLGLQMCVTIPDLSNGDLVFSVATLRLSLSLVQVFSRSVLSI